MVQIIPRTKQTFGEQVAGGIETGGKQGADLAKLFLQKALEGQNKDKELQRKLAAVEQFKKSPGYENLSPMQKFALEQEVGGLIGTGSSKSLINAERESKLQEMVAGLFSGQNKGQPSAGMGEAEEAGGIPGSGMENISPEQLAQLSLLSPELGRSLQHSQEMASREKREKEKAKVKEQQIGIQEKQFAHKETADYGKNLATNFDSAQEVKHAVNDLRGALKKGATGAKARNFAFKYLSSKKNPIAGLFQNEDTQAVINAQKVFASGFKQIFGSKPTEREFFWYENILPDLLKSGEVNEKVADYFERSADLIIQAQAAYDDIVKKNKGFRPIDIDVQVREKLKPKADKLIEEGEKLSGYVLMRDPNGIVRSIPKSQVDKALAAGGVKIE
jgi:hypothetical protein